MALKLDDYEKSIPRIYDLQETGYDSIVHYNSTADLDEKITQALVKSLEGDNTILIGVFYKNEIISTFGKRIKDIIPNYLENPPTKQTISAKDGKPTTNISKILDSLKI